jgi:hypothetical protein
MLVCVLSILAQQSTGEVRGQVTDETGAVIVGADVIVTGADGQQASATTNNAGEYVISNLAPGKYTVLASEEGFAPYENADLTVAAGRRDTLNILLAVELKEEMVVQAGGRGINTDPERGASEVVLSGADLDALSDDPDQLAADLQSLIGPADGPNISQITVDGFSGGKIPPKSSIREVRVNANPFAAEQDYFGFGRIDIFTKPGAGKFTGQAFMNFNDESLNARNPFAPNRAPFQTRFYGGSVSGPLRAKRASFTLDFERRDITENAVVNATVLDGSFNVVPFSQVVVTPQQRHSFSARVDYQLNQNHTLVARLNHVRSTQSNAGVGGFSLPSRAFDLSGSDTTFQVTETATLGTNLLNETRFQYIRESLARAGDNSVPTVNVLDAFVGGGAPYGLASNRLELYELQNTTTWVNGNHTLKAGGRFRGFYIDDVAPTNFGGTFTFSSLEEYRQVLQGVAGARPAQFSIAGGDPRASARRLDLHVFVQDDWRLAPNFMLSLGLRSQAQTRVSDKLNLGPRVSFAWAPGAANAGRQPKTVIRGGGGIFYFSYSESLMLLTNRFNGLNQQQFIINRPDFFAEVPSIESLAGAALPQTIRRADADLNQPYSLKGSLSIERQLPRRTTLSVAYIYERDKHLLRSRNINAPLPGTYDPETPGSGVRPIPGVGNIFAFESTATNIDNTVFIRLNTQPTKDLSAFALVGLSRETGDSDGPLSFPANSYDLSSEYGSVLNNVYAFANVGINYSGPWGLTFNSLIRASSPNRFNIVTGFDTNGDGVFTERPAFADDPTQPGVIVTPFGAFDPDPAPGQALIPRNYGRGPSFFQVNLRVAKTFRFDSLFGSSTKPGKADAKRYSLTFSAQAQNIFNNSNFGPFIGNLNSPLFGQANATAGSARRLDLGMRFAF